MKKIISFVLIITMLLTCIPASAMDIASQNKKVNKIIDSDFLLDAANRLEAESEEQVLGLVEMDLSLLESAHVDTAALCSIQVEDGKIVYGLDYPYADAINYLTVKKDAKGNITIDVTEGNKHNVLIFKSDGSLILDGHKINVFEGNVEEVLMPIPGRYIQHSPSPFKSTSYGTAFTEINQEKINTGTPIGNIAISVLAGIIGAAVEFATKIPGFSISVGVLFDTVVKGLRNYNVAYSPSNAYFSFKLKRYRHPDSIGNVDVHYKYACTFYPKESYDGSATSLNYYEWDFFN